MFSYTQEVDGPCLGIATRQALRSLLPRIVEEAREGEKPVKGVGQTFISVEVELRTTRSGLGIFMSSHRLFLFLCESRTCIPTCSCTRT